jgi:glycosyltransferase involved in cell wall biosynthesis
MQRPNVSIIIPALNEELEIKQCLNTLLHQIDGEDEIIVVDNGSTDNTVALIQNMKSDKIIVIHETKLGTGYARRLGFDSAHNEVLIRIDADSRALDGWLDNIKRAFTDDQTQAWSGYIGFKENTLTNIAVRVFNIAAFDVNKAISGHNNLFGSNMALRSTVWASVKNDVRDSMDYWEDLEIACALNEIGINPIIEKKTLLNISYRGGQTSFRKFHRRMNGGIRTYWKRNKIASILSIPLAYSALFSVTIWRLLGKLSPM